MKLCKFSGDQIGLVDGDRVYPIEGIKQHLPPLSWPLPLGDPLIANWDAVLQLAKKAGGAGIPLSEVALESPISSPSKIIAAPLNYNKHVEEVGQDAQIHANTHAHKFEGYATPIAKLGLFLKANSSLAGPSQPLRLTHPDRRNDYEVELCAIIGQECKNVSVEKALDVVAAWTIGLDMTLRGPEERSFRKSPDGYTILGPWLVTPDEIANPSNLDLWLTVNGEEKQRANTSQLIVGIAELIALASQWYTLYPGDVIMTGTPDGVGSIVAGDEMVAGIEAIGEMRVHVC